MTRRVKRLLGIALAVVALTMYFACSQPDDVLTEKSMSHLLLDAQLLPAAPMDMAYELWIVNEDPECPTCGQPINDTISLGKFTYDPVNKEYLDLFGEPRDDGNLFVLEGDVYRYEWLLVSVETMDDFNLESPGPIMLRDRITDPDDNPIELTFPEIDSVWYAIVDFSMRTFSDGDRTINNGAGIWFASYSFQVDTLVDTTDFLNVFISDLVFTDTPPTGETITTPVIDLTWYTDTLDTIMGFDTIQRIVVRYEEVRDTFVEPPFGITTVEWDVQLGASQVVEWDRFAQGGEALYDYTRFGWRYKGWVVSPNIGDASQGTMTLPAWRFPFWFDGAEDGLLTTGTFIRIDQPDDSNPFALSDRIPPYPGEEFFQNLPGGVSEPVNLAPEETGNRGTVFITLEPDNMVHDSTNFPLLLLVKSLPSDRDTVEADDQQQVMTNSTQINDPDRGFPSVSVGIRRF